MLNIATGTLAGTVNETSAMLQARHMMHCTTSTTHTTETSGMRSRNVAKAFPTV